MKEITRVPILYERLSSDSIAVDNPYGYIYITTNLITHKKYVGQHKHKMFDKSYYGSGILLQKALNNYGKENFIVEILDWAETCDELLTKEYYWIEKLNCIQSDNYYNLVDGGGLPPIMYGEDNPSKRTDVRKKISDANLRRLPELQKQMRERNFVNNPAKRDDVKEKMSANHADFSGSNNPFYNKHHTTETKEVLRVKNQNKCGENNPNYGNHKLAGKNHPNYGKHLSESTKKKIGNSNRGKVISDETKEKLSVAMKNRVMTEEHKQKIIEANKRRKGTKMSPEAVQHMIDSRKKSNFYKHGGEHSNAKSICKLDLNGNLIEVYGYMGDVIAAGYGETSVRKCCKGVLSEYKGYKWMFKSEYDLMK